MFHPLPFGMRSWVSLMMVLSTATARRQLLDDAAAAPSQQWLEQHRREFPARTLRGASAEEAADAARGPRERGVALPPPAHGGSSGDGLPSHSDRQLQVGGSESTCSPVTPPVSATCAASVACSAGSSLVRFVRVVEREGFGFEKSFQISFYPVCTCSTLGG